jgi:hypothetical protein
MATEVLMLSVWGCRLRQIWVRDLAGSDSLFNAVIYQRSDLDRLLAITLYRYAMRDSAAVSEVPSTTQSINCRPEMCLHCPYDFHISERQGQPSNELFNRLLLQCFGPCKL